MWILTKIYLSSTVQCHPCYLCFSLNMPSSCMRSKASVLFDSGLTGFYLSGNVGFPYTLTVFLPSHTWWPVVGLCLSMTSVFRFQLTFQHTSPLVRLSVGLDAWYLKWLLIWLDVPSVFLFLKFASILCSLFPYIYMKIHIFTCVWCVTESHQDQRASQHSHPLGFYRVHFGCILAPFWLFWFCLFH